MEPFNQSDIDFHKSIIPKSCIDNTESIVDHIQKSIIKTINNTSTTTTNLRHLYIPYMKTNNFKYDGEVKIDGKYLISLTTFSHILYTRFALFNCEHVSDSGYRIFF
jgi:hypothetical protein